MEANQRLLALLLLGGLLALAGCSKEAEVQPVVTVQAATVERAPIQQVISAEAVLFPLEQAAITPKVTSPVRRFYVNRGSRVHRGQLLAVLENRDLSAAEVENKGAFEQAQATYANVTAAELPEAIQKATLDEQAAKQALDAQEKLYQSRENLYKQGALPRKDLDQAGVELTQARNQYELAQRHLAALRAGGEKNQLKAAQGQLTSAEGKYLGSKAELAYSEIRSPINGVVTDRPVYPGETPPAGTPLLTIMNTSRVIARAHIPQQEAALLKAGDKAAIIAPEVGEVPAKVTLVSPALDANSTTVEIWVEAANPDGRLRPGTTVRVSMVAKTMPDAVVVPAAALLTSTAGATSVMVIGADSRAHQQEVETGVRQDDRVQITKGLNPGERVVTTGAYGLPDNTKVEVAAAPKSGEAKTADDKEKP